MRRARVFRVGVDAFTDEMFAEMLARVGQREGFSVVARVGPNSVWADWLANMPNLTLAELPGVSTSGPRTSSRSRSTEASR